MESLILLIIFGLGAAFFATQNTGSVHILIGNYVFSAIPLYVIVIGSLLIGVFISWLVSFVNAFSTFFTLQRKDIVLQKAEEKITMLEEKNHELELKLAHMTDESDEEEKNEEEKASNPSLLQHFRQSLHLSPR